MISKEDSNEIYNAFENAVSSLFRNLRKIGKYDSGNIGHEFNSINIEIKNLKNSYGCVSASNFVTT